MKLPPVVLIEWLDATHPAGEWMAISDVSRTGALATIYSAGFLIHEDKSRVVIAVSHDGENVSGEMAIPVRMIRRRRKLRRR